MMTPQDEEWEVLQERARQASEEVDRERVAAYEQLWQQHQQERGNVHEHQATDLDVVAQEFRRNTEGKLDPAFIEKTIASLHSFTTSVSATAVLTGGLFYMNVGTFCNTVTGRPKFEGHAGGLFTIGGTSAYGYLFYNNQAELYTTTDFYAQTSVATTFIIFYDRNSNVVGTFSSGFGIGSFAGFGGGGGHF